MMTMQVLKASKTMSFRRFYGPDLLSKVRDWITAVAPRRLTLSQSLYGKTATVRALMPAFAVRCETAKSSIRSETRKS